MTHQRFKVINLFNVFAAADRGMCKIMIVFYCPRLGDVQDNDNVFAAPYDNAAENVLLSQMDVCKIMIMQLKPLLTLLVRLKLAASNIKPHQVPLPPHSNHQLTSVNEIWKGMDWQSIFKLQFSDLW